MTEQTQPGHFGIELLRAAAAAKEQAPQLAGEISLLTRGLAKRVSGGKHVSAHDIDVRTLIGLLEQSGVQIPTAPRSEPTSPVG